MTDVLTFLNALTWPAVAFIFGLVLLPIVAWRLLKAPAGSVGPAKWEQRISTAASNLNTASSHLEDLALATAKARLAEMEITSGILGANAPDLVAAKTDLEAIVRKIEENK